MRKLTELQRTLLNLLYAAGGSYCPGTDLDPLALRALAALVRANRLTVEPTDGGNRYHLTAQGRADAS